MAFVFSENDPFGDLAEKSMAESVTRHALNPNREEFSFLLCGLDSLDLALFVDWGEHWTQVKEVLRQLKKRAQGTEGLPDEMNNGRSFLHHPSGGLNYSFHVQFPEYHLFFNVTGCRGKRANGYLSLGSQALWQLGVDKCIDLLWGDLKFFMAQIEKITVSRCDVCADFFVPGGLSLDFLSRHRVGRSRATSQHMSGSDLETFYVGAAKAPIRLRLYDKTKEVAKRGNKLWFYDLWATSSRDDVWRVEFQVRRPALRQFQINNLKDLENKVGGLWSYLTQEWFSLREWDNEKSERRTIHPLWVAVQGCAEKLGPAFKLQRNFEGEILASIDWYVAHIAGCLPSFGARIGAKNFSDAMNQLESQITQHWFEKNFDDELRKRIVKLGRHPELKGERDV